MSLVYIRDKNGNFVAVPYVKVKGADGYTPVKGVDYHDGRQGDPGYSPVRGVDYWTEEDIQQMNNESRDYIATELAKRGQLKPEFANSIGECTDTTKLYVLPDGYIYAYMTKTGALFTNQIVNAIGTDGLPYNGGLGFKKGWRFGARACDEGTVFEANGVAQDRPNGVLIGMIPYDPSEVKTIRVSGYKKAPSTDDYILFFDENYAAFYQLGRIGEGYINSRKQTFEDEPAFNNKVKTFTFDIDTFSTATTWYSDLIKSNAKYVAFSVMDADLESLVVTFDEEIVFGSETKWQSTGHMFVPADHEDRIIPLEERVENHEERIRTLEMYGADSTSGEDIPAYIKTEADGVMSRLMEKQGNRCFTMIGLSDFHYGGIGDNKDNLIRACKAISYIQGRIQVDAVATLGDNLPFGEGGDANMVKAHRWSKEINEILKITEGEGVAMFRTPGNHDRMGGRDKNGNDTSFTPDNMMYRYIGGYNRGCVVDVPGGWGYQDFASYKLRVILLNTAEVDSKGRFSDFSGFHMSTKQFRWLIDTLDMTDKPDAEEWQILILSHHRPDDYQVGEVGNEWGANSYLLPRILWAYRNGNGFSSTRIEDGEVVTCDFNGKNKAKLIGSIHGHHHAYIYSHLYLGSAENSNVTDIMAVSTPTTNFGSGAGHNDDNNNVWYDSVKDTASETAFCVYSIDLDNHVIHAIHYGNGIDREIPYE